MKTVCFVTDSNGDEVSDTGNTDGESFSSIDDLLFDMPDQADTSIGMIKFFLLCYFWTISIFNVYFNFIYNLIFRAQISIQ